MPSLKLIYSSIIIFLVTLQGVSQETIILEGAYQKRNIFVENTEAPSGIGYCIIEVRVNGNLITDEIHTRAFEIDLTVFNLKLKDPVIIEIKHKKGCTPRILNPEALQTQPTFYTQSIEVDESGILRWITTDEHGSLPFIIQQYKWNKWVDVGEVKGKGEPSLNVYEHKVYLVSGENKFRVVQKIDARNYRKSPSTTIISDMPQLNFVYNRKDKQVIFSNPTAFEIHDKYGQLLMRGFNSQADVRHLSKDEYYISYDNVTETFAKK